MNTLDWPLNCSMIPASALGEGHAQCLRERRLNQPLVRGAGCKRERMDGRNHLVLGGNDMKTLWKTIGVACVGIALVLALTTGRAQAQPDCCFNPLFLPFAVAGAVVGTAAAVVSAPFYPCTSYYGPDYYPPPPHAYYGHRYRPRPYYHRQTWRSDHRGDYYHGRYGTRVYRDWSDD